MSFKLKRSKNQLEERRKQPPAEGIPLCKV